jgi:hypothetical protein
VRHVLCQQALKDNGYVDADSHGCWIDYTAMSREQSNKKRLTIISEMRIVVLLNMAGTQKPRAAAITVTSCSSHQLMRPSHAKED